MSDKVSINFKVNRDVKDLLDQLVVLKTVTDNKKSSQHDVFEAALVELLNKFNSELSTKSLSIVGNDNENK